MICRKCKTEVPAGPFCSQCGAKQEVPKKKPRVRGNGQGSVYQLPNKKWLAIKVCYYLDSNGISRRRSMSRCFDTKRDAVNALPSLEPRKNAARKAERKRLTTFKELFDLWIPTHRVGQNTLWNYQSAINWFAPIHNEKAADVDIDDLQECIDECPRGKSTKRNMRTTAGLMYKYGIPRGYFPEKLNLAEYLVISGEEGSGGVGLPENYVEQIRMAIGRLPGADYVYCHCYLGFRPSELLALDIERYDPKERAFVGGAKTEAGKDRTVTVSPKIQPIIDHLICGRTSGPVFLQENGTRMDLRTYRDMFYQLLEDLGLDNPTYEVNGQQKHTYTPHSCRHTFATLMKRVKGNNKDKLELIGHTSDDMLRYYQDVSLDDLRRITDAI